MGDWVDQSASNVVWALDEHLAKQLMFTDDVKVPATQEDTTILSNIKQDLGVILNHPSTH